MKLPEKLITTIIAAILLLAAAPVSARTGGGAALVCLDAGHGGADSGANYHGLMEKEPNLDIALRTRTLLQSLGYRVIMTRTADTTMSLQERCDIANNARADVFVSIHNNAYMTTSEGTETYCYYGSPDGRRLATFIHQEVVNRIRLPDRGVKEAGFYVLKNTNMTAALVEGAFVSNEREARLLQDPAFRQKIADGVAAGVYRYLIDPGRFDEFILLQNPDPVRAAELELSYMLGDGTVERYTETVPPASRRTVRVDDYIFNRDVSTLVVSTNGVPVVSERAQYFNFEKGRGGHGAPGVQEPATEWYLAEASTDWGFTSYIVVQNPFDVPSRLTMTFMRDDGYNLDRSFALEPHSRFTLDCSVVEGFEKEDFSVKLVSERGVVVERAMYFRNKYGPGGHVSPAVSAPSTRWYLAEGHTGGKFQTYLVLANPNPGRAVARVAYLLPGGVARVQEYELLPNSRRTVDVNAVPGLSATDVALQVDSDLPVIAERSTYFDYFGITEGSNSTGVTMPSETWYLAEGYTGPGFTTYVVMMNPGGESADAALRFMLEDGGERECVVTVPPGARKTVKVNDVAGMSGKAFSTFVSGSRPLVVERAKYYSYGDKSGGDSSVGVTAPALRWYFAEGCTR